MHCARQAAPDAARVIALAIDLGAGSGRAMAGRFDGARLAVHEMHRFPNDPVRAAGRLYWDILRLYHEVQRAIGAAHDGGMGTVSSVGIDTWGVDFGLVDRRGELVGNPYHYRDEGTRGVMDEVFGVVPRQEIFARTGIQFMPLNTLYRLYAIARDTPGLLDHADALLLIPDLLRSFLTGERSSEYTNASTTQFLNLETGDWDRPLLARLGLPSGLLVDVVPPAAPAGRLLPAVAAEIGVPSLPVFTVASHDTASAVVAVPARGEFAYLSSGTWSLLGTEVEHPVVDAQALAWNFTNEGGVGAFRLLKNIMGLWLVEGCRRSWEREGRWPGYDAIAAATLAASPFRSLIDPDAPRLLNPNDMPREIAAACLESGHPAPETPGAVMRCVLESLALAYRLVLERTEWLSGRRFAGLHVIGGGTRNTVLMQFTANAIGRPVWGGPAEATAIGNLLCQLIAAGRVASIAEGRDLVRGSFPPATFEPRDTAAWDDAYARFLRLLPA
jgi:rhamnulokinase